MAYDNEDNIKCPYCGYEDQDSWEFDQDSGVHGCGDCGKEFNVERDIAITYSTKKIDCKENQNEHNYKFDDVFKSDKKYENGKFVNLPTGTFRYVKIVKCEICDDKEYINIPLDEFEEYEKGGKHE